MVDSIELNTNNGQNAITTSVFIGILDCIIVQTEVPINLTINSSLGYNILTRTCKGIEYIAPRHKTQEPKENLLGGLQLDRFNLNEKLDIIISGQTNSDVKLIFRTI